MPPRRRTRLLTREEHAAWRASVADVAAFTEKERTELQFAVPLEPLFGESPLFGEMPSFGETVRQSRLPVAVPAAKAKAKALSPVVSAGDYRQVDKRHADRFRKGKTEIDGTLDLHGMTRDRAHAALLRFVAAHTERHSRTLLVITGKGGPDEQGRRAGGALQLALPGWLAELGGVILAFDRAQPKDGGSGAFYIRLRRKRNGTWGL